MRPLTLTATKATTMLQIPRELLDDAAPFDFVVVTPEEYAQELSDMRIARRDLDVANAPRTAKVKLTWAIKRKARFTPTHNFLRMVMRT